MKITQVLETTTMDYQTIPKDVIELILLEITDPPTILSFALSCKKFYQLFQKNRVGFIISTGFCPPLFLSHDMPKLMENFTEQPDGSISVNEGAKLECTCIEHHPGGMLSMNGDFAVISFEDKGTITFNHSEIIVPKGRYVIPVFPVIECRTKTSKCRLFYINHTESRLTMVHNLHLFYQTFPGYIIRCDMGATSLIETQKIIGVGDEISKESITKQLKVWLKECDKLVDIGFLQPFR